MHPLLHLDLEPLRLDLVLDLVPLRLDLVLDLVLPHSGLLLHLDLEPLHLDLEPLRLDLEPLRLDLAPLRLDLEPLRLDLEPLRLDLAPLRLDLVLPHSGLLLHLDQPLDSVHLHCSDLHYYLHLVLLALHQATAVPVVRLNLSSHAHPESVDQLEISVCTEYTYRLPNHSDWTPVH